jgi:pyridoxal phosphate enzyme (YggS family)
MESPIRINIARVLENIREGALLSGRKATDVKLMAVTKTVSDDRIMEALNAGISLIGENYVQEATRKEDMLQKTYSRVRWHMIGRLQTNKAKYAVKLFDMIHSLDRMELALELDKRSKAAERKTKVLIEVNTSGEASKSGIPISKAMELVKVVSDMENLSIMGLMTMPPWLADPEKSRPYFAALRELKEKIASANIPSVRMEELSMGMTDDYMVAIEEGATIVRIGRGIFGERPVRV